MRKVFCFIVLLQCIVLRAQNVFEGIEAMYELQMSVSKGQTPLWLNANKYGLSSPCSNNGFVRTVLSRDIHLDDSSNIGIGYGLDIALPYNYSTSIALQQLFAELRYKRLTLSIGSKNRKLELKNQQLSSGSQTLGINARSVPQVRIGIEDYYTLPIAGRSMSIKGHIAYGYMTDGHWQKEFTNENVKWTEGTLYHSKAGFLKIGKSSSPLNLELGLEMATIFGGTVNCYNERKEQLETFKGGNGVSDFWYAFMPGGKDFSEEKNGYVNAEGDLLGSWIARLTYSHKDFDIALYGDLFFEDHSAMYHLGYYGYGQDGDWQKRNEELYLYPLKDGLFGLEINIKRQDYLKDIVLEYIDTRYQSGPIYHDHTSNISDQIGGLDNYYNHQFYSGWQYYGQVMGNPLYLSPIYNDNSLEIQNNRFFAWHLGLQGYLNSNLKYRFLSTWQKCLGTYRSPYTRAKKNVSILLESEYLLSKVKGLSVRTAFGLDSGTYLGDNIGMQISLIYKI